VSFTIAHDVAGHILDVFRVMMARGLRMNTMLTLTDYDPEYTNLSGWYYIETIFKEKKMAGYDYDSWKSNNALAAEDNGLLKAGQIAKRYGVSLAAVQSCAIPAEWHHVGGGFGRVNYYQPDQVDSVVEAMRAYDDQFRPHSLLAANVKYLEWPAFKVGRFSRNSKNRPTEVRLENCRVSFPTPNTVIIIKQDGEQITKRTNTKGLEIEEAACA